MPDKDNKKINYHEGHRNRVRARISADPELKTFAPHELLEFILFHAIPRKDTNELAHLLIDTFGSFSGVLDASLEDLSAVKGMTTNAAYLLKSFIPVTRAYSIDKQQNHAVLMSPSDFSTYFKSYFLNRNSEALYAIYMDINHRVISVVDVGKNGNVSNIDLDVVKLQRTAIANKASKIVLMHNHPGNTLYPSDSDLITTNLAIVLLYSLRVTLEDHIIFGTDGSYFSFFSNHVLDALVKNCNNFLAINIADLYKGRKKLKYDNNGIIFSESETEALTKNIDFMFEKNSAITSEIINTVAQLRAENESERLPKKIR